VPFDADLVEGVLEQSEIVDELVLTPGLPVDLGHGHFARVHYIDDLAVDGSRTQLLDLGQVQLNKTTPTCSRSFSHFRMSFRETKYPSSIIPMFSF